MIFQKSYTQSEAMIQKFEIECRIINKEIELKRAGKNKLHIQNIIQDLKNWKNHVTENSP